MTPWTLLRSLPRIADTLLDLVHLSQEQNLLLREVFHAQHSRTAQTPTTRLTTAQHPPLDPDAAARAASRRPPARGDQVWQQTRPALEKQERERVDRKLNPHRYPDQPRGTPLAEAAKQQRRSRTDTPPPSTR